MQLYLFCLCVYLWALSCADARREQSRTKIHGLDVDFKPCNRSQRGLFIVTSFTPPRRVKSIIDKGVYLTDYVDSSMNYTVYEPSMKYPPDLNTTNHFRNWGVSVRTDNQRFRMRNTTCTIQRASRRHVWVLCDEDHLVELANRTDVYWISSIPYIDVNSIASRRLLTGNTTPPPTMWNGTGTIVLVSDTGLDVNHCAFYDAANSVQYNSYAPNAHNKIVGIKTSVSDFIALAGAHGTATASVAVGAPCVGESGVAPFAKLAFLDMSTNDQYLYLPPDFENVLEDAISHGVSVHSASWGTATNGAYTDLDNMFDTVSYENPRFVHVVSAGNSGPSGKVGSPGSAKSPISTGSAYSRPEDYFPTSSSYTYQLQSRFSSVGPLADGRRAPLVLAPGESVNSAHALAPPSVPNQANYGRKSGTSLSAPGIAGLVLLLQQRYKTLHSGILPLSSLITATLIAHTYAATAVDGGGGSLTSYGTPIMDWESMIDLEGIITTSFLRYCFIINSTESVPRDWVIAIAWTDPPAHPGSSQTLINNLDMYIINENGELIGESKDLINSFDRIVVPAQNIRIVVYANAIDTVNQYFSIHIRGKGVASECAGTCLPTEFQACTGGKRMCTFQGDFSACKKQECDTGYCGETCSTICGFPCSIEHGTGALNNGTCLAQTCEHPYFLTDSGCACLPGTAVTCSYGWGACTNNLVCSNPPQLRANTASITIYDLRVYAIIGIVLFICL